MAAVVGSRKPDFTPLQIDQKEEKFDVKNLPLDLGNPNVQDLINRIDAFEHSPEQVQSSLFCLSRANEPGQEGQYKGIYISTLKNKINRFLEAPDTRQYVLEALQHPAFIFNGNLQEVERKTNYLIKNRFFSNAANGFLLNTKYSHHLSNIIKSVNSSISVGIGLIFMGTLPFTLSGIAQIISPDNSSGVKYGVGIPSIAIGAGFLCAPFIEAYHKSGKSNP